MQGKLANFKSMVSAHCATLLGHVAIIWTDFDPDFVSQIKLTKLPLIHHFVEQKTAENKMEAKVTSDTDKRKDESAAEFSSRKFFVHLH